MPKVEEEECVEGLAVRGVEGSGVEYLADIGVEGVTEMKGYSSAEKRIFDSSRVSNWSYDIGSIDSG